MEQTKPYVIPAMTPEQMKTFVRDYIDGKIFSLHHMPPDVALDTVAMVFMPIAMGMLSALGPEGIKNVGTIYEYLVDAVPRSVNGYPVFLSCKLVDKADWEKAREKILKILEAREESLKEFDT